MTRGVRCRVDFEGGTVVPTPSGFAEQVGVTVEEGAGQLEQQGQHIKVPKGTVKLVD